MKYVVIAKIIYLQVFEAYTQGSAEALRNPKIGSLVDGNLAYLIAIERDPLAVADNQLQHINVVGTRAGGKSVWQFRVIYLTTEDISNTPLFFGPRS